MKHGPSLPARLAAGQGVLLLAEGDRREISYQGYDHFR